MQNWTNCTKIFVFWNKVLDSIKRNHLNIEYGPWVKIIVQRNKRQCFQLTEKNVDSLVAAAIPLLPECMPLCYATLLVLPSKIRACFLAVECKLALLNVRGPAGLFNRMKRK